MSGHPNYRPTICKRICQANLMDLYFLCFRSISAAKMDLNQFKRDSLKDVLTKIDELDFDAIYTKAIEMGLMTPKEKKIVSSERMCNQMYKFLETVQGRDDFFEKFIALLIDIKREDLKGEICDRYFTRISNVLHIDEINYTTESLDDLLMQQC